MNKSKVLKCERCNWQQMQKITYRTQGETGLVVELGVEVDPNVNARVHALGRRIKENLHGVIVAVVPTYRSLSVLFDPLQISRRALINSIDALVQLLPEQDNQMIGANLVIIPTLYGGEAGPDIEFVASHNHYSIEQVISIHSSVSYQIYMMGFTPGFPYLGGMSERIAAPRLSTPRTKIPAGSVGIAGTQTGLYPQSSPGGWQIIGRTPLKVFNPSKLEPFLYKAGDFLRFEPISVQDFERISFEVAQGSYTPQVTQLVEVAQ